MSESTTTQKPVHGQIIWNELLTRDPEAAKEFYSELIGWDPQSSGMPGMDYTLLKNNGKDAGGMMMMPADVPAMVPSHWAAYIAVDDVDAVAAKVESLGGKIIVPPTDIPNVGRFCTLADPTGATISVLKMVG
jgi:predicted enzyme related to lactoylglutathione lyase